MSSCLQKQSGYLLFLLLIGNTFTSCTAILLRSAGIRSPKTEQEQTLSSFAHELQIADYRQVICTYDGWPKNTSLLLMKGNVFNRRGQLLNIPTAAHKEACGPAADLFLLTLDKTKSYPLADTLALDTLKQTWLLPGGRPFTYTLTDTADFIVVIPWAKFLGRKQFKQKVTPCLQAMKDNRKARFDVILVNIDYQKVWGGGPLKNTEMSFTWKK